MSYLEIRYAKNKKVPYDEKFAHYLFEDVMRRHLPHNPTSIAEIGLGTGKLAEKFSTNHSLKVRGFDIERFEGLHKDIDFFEGSVENIPNLDVPKSDVCFSKSVIEHVDDFRNFFRASEHLISDDGIVIVLCPNWKTQWKNFYDDPTHLRPFNVVGLRTAAQICGLEVLSCSEFYQLPLVWKLPALGRFLEITRIRLPERIRNRNPALRFSYENMLLLVARKSKNV